VEILGRIDGERRADIGECCMRTCENCGSRVYALGCVNCDEVNYIAEQEAGTARIIREQEAEDWAAKRQARALEGEPYDE
jgi:hypothetical protein